MPVVQALIDYTGDAPLLCDTYKKHFTKNIMIALIDADVAD